MKKSLIRSFAGSFAAFAVANDLDKSFEICRKFCSTKEDAYFIFQVAVVLAKLGDEFSEDESHTLDKITDFFNELLREGEIRP